MSCPINTVLNNMKIPELEKLKKEKIKEQNENSEINNSECISRIEDAIKNQRKKERKDPSDWELG